MKKITDPIEILGRGFELVAWIPLLIALSVLGVAGTTTFAVLWWMGR